MQSGSLKASLWLTGDAGLVDEWSLCMTPLSSFPSPVPTPEDVSSIAPFSCPLYHLTN